MHSSHPEVPQAIINELRLTDEIEASLRAALAEFNQSKGYQIPEAK
jgi:hypothetical protein